MQQLKKRDTQIYNGSTIMPTSTLNVFLYRFLSVITSNISIDYKYCREIKKKEKLGLDNGRASALSPKKDSFCGDPALLFIDVDGCS